MRKLILTLACLLLMVTPASAQSDARVTLSAPETTGFPLLRFYMDLHDAGGNFIQGLQTTEVTILENNQPVTPSSVEMVEPGVHFLVAINAGPALARRDAAGISRYQRIGTALQTWATNQPETSQDEYSLIGNTGSIITRTSSAQDWLSSFNGYQPDQRNAQPASTSLSEAINLTLDSPTRPNMGKAILYITPAPEKDAISEYSALVDRIQQSATPLYIWLVGSPAETTSAGAQFLADLAAQTGGSLYTDNDTDSFPDPESFLAPLRNIYQVSYTSTIITSGQQSLAVDINHGDLSVTSQPLTFNLNIQAPNPMLISPPEEINRTSPADSRAPLQDLTPVQTTIKILIEFPDGYKRSLKSTSLIVDGETVATNTSTPFDTFNWNLSDYSATGKHRLQVQVEDSLGLTKTSVEVPVTINVSLPPVNLWTASSHSNLWLASGALALAGFFLGAVLLRGSRKSHRQKQAERANLKDPVTQPLPPRKEKHTERVSWMKRGNRPPSGAKLVLLSDQNESITGQPILIDRREIAFGRDPALVNCVFDSPTVDPLHARLYCRDDGSFWLADMGSIAGTWINYAPISTQGARLEHNDIIHIGKVALRFVMDRPDRILKPQVLPYREGL